MSTQNAKTKTTTDNSGSSAAGSSSQSVAARMKKLNVNKPNINDARKLKLKAGGGGGGGRNLLPSKVTVTQTSGSEKTNGAAKPKPLPAYAPPKKTPSLDAYYGNYLQCFMESALLEEIKKLKKMSELDSMASKCSDIAVVSTKMNKVFADRKASHVSASLNHLETIRSAFDNLVDFTGEETLTEIHSILTNKYEKLRVEGATINEPLFQDNELEKLLNVLRAQPSKTDETKVTGWCLEFIDKLKNLTVSSDSSVKNSTELAEAARVLLENCSLLACDNAKNAVEREAQLLQERERDLTEKPIKEESEAEKTVSRISEECNETLNQSQPEEECLDETVLEQK